MCRVYVCRVRAWFALALTRDLQDIADVTYFYEHGSLLDIEARTRATTIYLADRRLDMIPPVLSEQLCSLRGQVDRLAVSVLWTLDKDYQVPHTRRRTRTHAPPHARTPPHSR